MGGRACESDCIRRGSKSRGLLGHEELLMHVRVWLGVHARVSLRPTTPCTRRVELLLKMMVLLSVVRVGHARAAADKRAFTISPRGAGKPLSLSRTRPIAFTSPGPGRGRYTARTPAAHGPLMRPSFPSSSWTSLARAARRRSPSARAGASFFASRARMSTRLFRRVY